MLGQKLQSALKNAGISALDAATQIGISEANLYRLFKKDTFEVAYLRKAAAMLNLPISFFLEESPTSEISQIGDFNQAGSGNSQKIKVSKAPSQELAAELAACRRELELTRALVDSKDETITLLRATYKNPN